MASLPITADVCPARAIFCSVRLPLLKYCGGGGVLPRVLLLGGHLQSVHVMSPCLAAFDDDVDGEGQRDVDGHLHRVPGHLLG